MKKEYLDFEISVIVFQNEDIVTASGGLLDFGADNEGDFDFGNLFPELFGN